VFSAVCLNCPQDRCHGWTCSPGDGNSDYTKTTLADGNVTLTASGNGGWDAHHCLTSLSGGIASKVEMQPCDATDLGQKWSLDTATGLLLNRAVQASQAMDLCPFLKLFLFRPSREAITPNYFHLFYAILTCAA